MTYKITKLSDKAYCCLLLFFLSVCMLMTPVWATSLEIQRSQFLDAKRLLYIGKIESFKDLAVTLRDYPLYPYLLYDYLRPRLWQVEDKEIINFLKRYGDLPMANDLRKTWLRHLAKRRRWQTYIDNYTPQSDEVLQCYYLNARLKTNNRAYLLEDTRTVWLSGQSLPSQCDVVFKQLYNSDLMTAELVWKRINLSMANGKTSLAKYLSNRLNNKDKRWVARWIATHHNPAKWTKKPAYPDTVIARDILSHGINRLTSINIDKAITYWDKLKLAYAFPDDVSNKIERRLAVQAAQKNHRKARELLDQLDTTEIDKELFQWRLSVLLKDRDWNSLLDWTSGKPPVESIRNQWLYWHARALQETGNHESAEEVFTIIAEERDYYGFLAADHLGKAYKMNYLALPEDLEEWQNISKKPAVQRAHELYLLGMVYSARREWHHAFSDMTSYQLQIAAAIAANWGWHDRTILTLGKAQAYDDLILRFPLPYAKTISHNANKKHLELSWVYALTRAESIFMEDARSPAGALGLMQVMPATGKETAKSLGWKRFYGSHLLQAEKNISIGTAYMKLMLDKFNNNIVLATAAYNAGPSNVIAWLPQIDCMEPDIWIEQIPFKETRGYVRRILYYASIYDWRLQQAVKPVRERMAMINSKQGTLVTSLTCPAPLISLKANDH